MWRVAEDGEGYLVVSPDYFEGEQLEVLQKEEGFEFPAWATKKRGIANTIVEKFIPAVKEKFGTSSPHLCYPVLY